MTDEKEMVGARVAGDTEERLTEYSENNGLSRSDAIRRLLRTSLNTTNDDRFLRREPVPTAIRYVAIAGAFTIAWTYLNGNVETAAALSKGLGICFLGLGIAEWVLPLAESAGDRLGKWWRSRQGVEP